MKNEKQVAPICEKCKHKTRVTFYCLHPDVPITDFLTGKTSCSSVNHLGQCRLYEDKQLVVGEGTKDDTSSITVDLVLNTEPFKKKIADLLAGLS